MASWAAPPGLPASPQLSGAAHGLVAPGATRGLSAPRVAVFAMTAAWLGGANMIGADTLWLFLIGLPALALGTWLGLKLFGKLDDQAFRRVLPPGRASDATKPCSTGSLT
jgi:hypothetical protein